MTVLLIGATGQVGRHVARHLVENGADVRALVRDPARADLPASVSLAQGDLLDVDSLRRAFQGVSTLFLLNAVVPDEVTQALVALNVARESGVKRVVYLSVMHADRWVNVPHFAGKGLVERLLQEGGFEATVLRPAYFMDNDRAVRDVVVQHGVYPMPVGRRGLAMVDVRDIAEVAALELLRRARAAGPLAFERIALVGPDILTGEQVAAHWSAVLQRPVAWAGQDTAAFEQNLRHALPAWMAYDMRLMAERFESDGMVPAAGDVERLTRLLGRPLRSYRAFAAELA